MSAGGSVRQRPNGIWEARFRQDGRQRSVYGKTKREAQERLRAAMTAADNGVRQPSKRLSTAGWLHTWLGASVRASLRPQTVRSYEGVVRLYLVPTIGRIPVVRLSVDDVTRMLETLEQRGLTIRTRRYALTILRAALNRGVEAGVVVRNVARLVHPPRQDTVERQPFTVEQVAALFAATAEDRIGPLLMLSATTGLRQGEALALRWSDLDLEARTVSVKHTLEQGSRRLAPTKTERSRRTIYLPAMAVEALREQQRRQRYDRLLAGGRWQDAGFVFTTDLGTPLDAGNLTRRYHAARERAGLPSIPWHHLRHFAATALLEAGEDLFVVSRVLGHTSVATTATFYGHVRPSMLRRSADRMDELLMGESAN